MPEDIDWDPIRELSHRVLKRGDPLELDEATKSLLRQSAHEVAIAETDLESTLLAEPTAKDLLSEIARRIADGSDRIGDALLRMYKLQAQGDLDEARQQMRDVLAVECVHLYREIAEGELEKMDDLP